MQFHVFLLHIGRRWTVLWNCPSYKILRLWKLGPIVVREGRYKSIQIKGLWKVVASIYEWFWWFLRTSSVGGDFLQSGELGQRHRLWITYAWKEGTLSQLLHKFKGHQFKAGSFKTWGTNYQSHCHWVHWWCESRSCNQCRQEALIQFSML